MYIPGECHIDRLQKLGKRFDIKTLKEKRRLLNLFVEQFGTRKLTPHSLRYAYITRMRRDVAGEMVQKMVGHTSIAMTDYYTRSAIPELCKAIEPARNAVNTLFE